MKVSVQLYLGNGLGSRTVYPPDRTTSTTRISKQTSNLDETFPPYQKPPLLLPYIRQITRLTMGQGLTISVVPSYS